MPSVLSKVTLYFQRSSQNVIFSQDENLAFFMQFTPRNSESDGSLRKEQNRQYLLQQPRYCCDSGRIIFSCFPPVFFAEAPQVNWNKFPFAAKSRSGLQFCKRKHVWSCPCCGISNSLRHVQNQLFRSAYLNHTYFSIREKSRNVCRSFLRAAHDLVLFPFPLLGNFSFSFHRGSSVTNLFCFHPSVSFLLKPRSFCGVVIKSFFFLEITSHNPSRKRNKFCRKISLNEPQRIRPLILRIHFRTSSVFPANWSEVKCPWRTLRVHTSPTVRPPDHGRVQQIHAQLWREAVRPVGLHNEAVCEAVVFNAGPPRRLKSRDCA